MIISPWFNYGNVQTLSCRLIAQVKMRDSSAAVSGESPLPGSVTRAKQEVDHFDTPAAIRCSVFEL